MKLGIGQINPTIGDFEGNSSKILEGMSWAQDNDVDLIVFPEMSLCGYPPNDLLDHDAFAQENLKFLRKIQHASPSGVVAVVGYVDRNREHAGKPLMNVVSAVGNRNILFTQAKTLLPTYDVFDETRYFEPAAKRSIWEFMDERIGFAICEDLWWETEAAPGTRYPVDPVQEALDAGATLIVSPSASPYFEGKAGIRYSILSRIGKSSGVPVVYVNLVGGNDNLIFDGRSMVTSNKGVLVFLAESYREEFASIDLREERTALSLTFDRYREIEYALVLGLRDYLRKCGFAKVHFGLSGGVDSALVAVLATEAIGAENVTAFGLPSQYSSEGSINDAEELCANLGIRFEQMPIEDVFSEYLTALEPQFRGKEPDIAEENLQARIRGTLLMAYANKFPESLLLATGNKSELATGYCTLYGDMCGGLAVIGDLFKTDVYGLCRAINEREKVIPEAILAKAPSAELRPNQTDQDSLPPYEILDRVLRRYLLHNRTAGELEQEGFDPELVRRVLTLVGRSEYKRRQAPPVLKVSPRAFGTGRRMPISRKIYEA